MNGPMVDELSAPLLALHKAVLATERRNVERIHGAMSAAEFLQVVSDPLRYGWLKPLTELVLAVEAEGDEALQDELRDRACELLVPPKRDSPFGRRYLSPAAPGIPRVSARSAIRRPSSRFGSWLQWYELGVTSGEQRQRVGVVFGALMLVILLASLDQTIVSTALPTIVGDLGGIQHLSWVVTAYLLAATISGPLYGKLGDLYGRKVVLQAAIVLFLAGSALCGTSQDMTELIA